MHKVTFAERRSGVDRRKRRRRSLKRSLMEAFRADSDRRKRQRRAPYIRRTTYTVYEPDRI